MRYRIVADEPDGSPFECFVWVRSPASGIERAKADAIRFGRPDLANFRAIEIREEVAAR
jgi:hypothetical protein